LKGDKSAGRSILDSLTGKQAAEPKEAAQPPSGETPAATTAPRRKGLFGVLDELKRGTRKPEPAKPEPQTAPGP
jgi:hypothetical protein